MDGRAAAWRAFDHKRTAEPLGAFPHSVQAEVALLDALRIAQG